MQNHIRTKRIDALLTQEELSRLLKVSRQTVVSLEAGKYKPSLVLAHKLAQTFRCSIEELFIFEGEENIES